MPISLDTLDADDSTFFVFRAAGRDTIVATLRLPELLDRLRSGWWGKDVTILAPPIESYLDAWPDNAILIIRGDVITPHS